jgi:hypothetical protein
MQIGDQQFQFVNVQPERPRQKLGCAFLLLPLGGLIMLVVGIWFGYSSYDFYTNGVEVEGTVVRLSASSGEDGVTYSPVFAYEYQERDYEYESINSSDPPSKQVGEVTTLLVDTTEPTRAREKSFWELWLLPVIFLPVSIFMLALTLAIVIYVRFLQ